MSPDQLAIVIPVLNWDLSLLLTALIAEIHNRGLEDRVRIIIGDDGSRPEILRSNRAAVSGVEFITLVENEQPLGRAANRNRLLRMVDDGSVLFLDGDMLPDADDFLHTYLQARSRGHRVICGGYSYRTRVMDGREYDFYLYKGRRTEWLPANQRRQQPWRYLFTGNVLVDREVLQRVPFDESFAGYGYEDIEWGIRLEKEVGIVHIDNPCSHLGLIKKKVALERMKRSLPNYLRLRRLHPRTFAGAGVAGPVALLRVLPGPALRIMDQWLTTAFYALPWSPPAYLCFQLDKAVGMALALRRETRS